MVRKIDTFEDFHPLSRQEWREWLAKNHEESPGVWFVYFKKQTGRPRVTYEDAVQEALCFGWIDSLPRKLDEERTKLLFTPRKPKSVWSALNKQRIESLISSGLMQNAGMFKIERAKADGSWDALNDSDNLVVPKELKQALSKNPVARKNFDGFPVFVKRSILYWLGTAKRETTRLERTEKIVRMAANNKRANFDKE